LIILGIDPGTARCGLGIIEKKGNSLKAVSYGLIESDKERPQAERLEVVFVEVTRAIKKYSPDIVAVEKLFFSKNVKTAMSVGEARGVILLCAQLAGVTIREFSPMEVKLALTGYGMADKNQVMIMTKALLGLKETPKPDDVADALAIACCCASGSKMAEIKKKAESQKKKQSL
jgi:crossover junction endodeoxyribonuclease RuvC